MNADGATDTPPATADAGPAPAPLTVAGGEAPKRARPPMMRAFELVERVIVIANQQVVLDGPKAQVLQKLQTPPGAAPNTRAA